MYYRAATTFTTESWKCNVVCGGGIGRRTRRVGAIIGGECHWVASELCAEAMNVGWLPRPYACSVDASEQHYMFIATVLSCVRVKEYCQCCITTLHRTRKYVQWTCTRAVCTQYCHRATLGRLHAAFDASHFCFDYWFWESSLIEDTVISFSNNHSSTLSSCLAEKIRQCFCPFYFSQWLGRCTDV